MLAKILQCMELMLYKLKRSYEIRQMNSNEVKETSCDTIEIQCMGKISSRVHDIEL